MSRISFSNENLLLVVILMLVIALYLQTANMKENVDLATRINCMNYLNAQKYLTNNTSERTIIPIISISYNRSGPSSAPK